MRGPSLNRRLHCFEIVVLLASDPMSECACNPVQESAKQYAGKSRHWLNNQHSPQGVWPGPGSCRRCGRYRRDKYPNRYTDEGCLDGPGDACSTQTFSAPRTRVIHRQLNAITTTDMASTSTSRPWHWLVELEVATIFPADSKREIRLGRDRQSQGA